MPLLRINATPDGLGFHGAAQDHLLSPCVRSTAPIVIMVHGYKYDPARPSKCPHRRIFHGTAPGSWPAALGFCNDDPFDGLCIAFGWPARGGLGNAYRRARRMGPVLADLIRTLKTRMPNRPVHIIAHSLGTEMTLSCLPSLRAYDLDRMILLAGASYVSRAQHMLRFPSGQAADVLNIVARENDLFDHLFERLIPPDHPGDHALGCGLYGPNIATVELDCHASLQALERFGARIKASQIGVSHRSVYRCPGAMRFYARLMTHPRRCKPAHLHAALPTRPRARWSTLPSARWLTRRFALAAQIKNRMMA